MVGQREIRALRTELEQRDGDRFDLQAFHDQTIGHGSLPLATLRAQLPGWVRPQTRLRRPRRQLGLAARPRIG